jgi:hypothetical protein
LEDAANNQQGEEEEAVSIAVTPHGHFRPQPIFFLPGAGAALSDPEEVTTAAAPYLPPAVRPPSPQPQNIRTTNVQAVRGTLPRYLPPVFYLSFFFGFFSFSLSLSSSSPLPPSSQQSVTVPFFSFSLPFYLSLSLSPPLSLFYLSSFPLSLEGILCVCITSSVMLA